MRLRKYILTGLLVLGLVFASGGYSYAVEPAADSITIQQALDMAYKNNPDLRKAALTMEKAKLTRNDAAEMVTWIPTGGLVLPAYQQVINGYQQAEIGYQTAKKAESAARDGIAYNVVSAYCTALSSYNSMELNQAKLADAKSQLTMSSVARAVGTLADFDYEKAKTGTSQLEEVYKLSKSQYDGSMAKLRSLLGKGEDWQPDLSSRPTLARYERNGLDIEISRGLSEAADVWTKEAKLKIEESQQSWTIPGISSKMRDVNLGIAQADYEKSKRDAKASVEQLYYLLDTMEGQIAAAEKAYATAAKDREITELKYQVGMVAKSALSSVRVTELNARVGLENAKASLAQYKAQYAFLTGRQVYDAADWSEAETGPADKLK